MKSFSYVIKDEIGIHARPAGELAKCAKTFPGAEIVLKANGKEAKATKLMAIMGMGVKCGQEVVVEVSGENEDAVAEALEAFFKANL
jgi:phosphocarrier protein